MGKIFRTFLFLQLFQSIYSAAVYSELKCEEDHDCGKNFYCYKVSNICAECKPNFCSTINRRDSYLQCHKEYSECGPCLEGYEEEILTDGSPRAPCIRSNFLPLTKDPDDIQSSNYFFATIIGISLLAFIVIAVFVYRKRKPQVVKESDRKEESIPLNHLQQSQNPLITSAVDEEAMSYNLQQSHETSPITRAEAAVDERPPSFNPSAPTFMETEVKQPPKTIMKVEVNIHGSSGGDQDKIHHKKIENSSLSKITEPEKIPALNITKDQRKKVRENRVQAVKLRDADYENDLKYEIGEESQISPINEPDDADFDASYHNEETQESTWRPNASETTDEGASCPKTEEAPNKKKKLDHGTYEDEPDLVSRPFKRFSREKEE